jgi:hypothetical protein
LRQQVVRYECDSCHKIVEVTLANSIRQARVPKDWLHVDGYTNGQSVFKLDLCEECKKVVIQFTEKT